MDKVFGINGKHGEMGKSVEMGEFKGFTMAKLDELTRSLDDIRDMLEKQQAKNDSRLDDHRNRIRSLERFSSNISGRIMVLVAVAGILVAIGSQIVLSVII